jgi:predicted metal-dependent phosphoesterase TrpH
MFLADFHVHSNFSDGSIHLPDVVDMFGKRGFGCIAVTDHLCENESILAYLDCSLTPAKFPLYMAILKSEAERAWKQYKMVVLPGFELTKNSLLNHRSAHVLGIGITDYVSANQDIPELCRAIRAQGAVSVAAHPVWTRKIEKQTYHLWDRRRELEPEFDAWEVASGPHIFDEVANAKLPRIASSDMHVPRQMTSWKTVLDCERHPEAILNAIRKQQLGFRFFNDEGAKHYAHQLPVRVGNRPQHLALGNVVHAAVFPENTPSLKSAAAGFHP